MPVAMLPNARLPFSNSRADPVSRAFGRRVVSYAPSSRADVDYALPDLRRRIDQNTQALPMRLPVLVAGAVVLSMSGLLWLNLWRVAHVVGDWLITVT